MISFLFVDSECVWRGGQDQLFTLLRGLKQHDHVVHLMCHPRTLLEERAREVGVQVYPVAFHRGAGFIYFFRLLAVLNRSRPEILAFNTPRPILWGNLASRFSPVRVRIVFRRVSFPLRKNFITRIKYNWGITCIVAISESIRDQLKAGGVPGSKIRIIYEGMDPARYPTRKAPNTRRPGDPAVIGTVAHLSREKGLDYLVEAAALIPNVRASMRFIIVGDGKCRQALEDQVKKHGLEDCVRFVGFQNIPTQFLSQFDVFVLPSLSEGLSSAILTAMATCLPVVATDVGGIPELIRHGDNGLLVPAADAKALAIAIMRLADDPNEAFLMGQRGRKRMEEHFTLERKILETEQLCESLLRKPSPISSAAHA